MNITLHLVPIEEKAVLRNLLELYKYDFSEFDPEDVNEQGLYGYKYLDHYWTEDGRYAFLARADGKLAGFALLRQLGRSSEGVPIYSMAEFFVMKKYRRSGIGREIAFRLFDRFEGIWRVAQIEENMPARHFWRRIISDYTQEQFEELREPDWDGPIHRFRSRAVRYNKLKELNNRDDTTDPLFYDGRKCTGSDPVLRESIGCQDRSYPNLRRDADVFS